MKLFWIIVTIALNIALFATMGPLAWVVIFGFAMVGWKGKQNAINNANKARWEEEDRLKALEVPAPVEKPLMVTADLRAQMEQN